MYKVVKANEVMWNQPKENTIGALSKVLVDPGSAGAKHINFRLACYAPGTLATAHSHEDAENVFYVLQGHGIAILDGDRVPFEPGMAVFIPAKVEHAIHNTGDENLLMIFVASPPTLFPVGDKR